MERRKFLRNVAATSASASLLSLASSRAASPNDRIRIGLIGCGKRGRFVAGKMLKSSNTQLVAACDVWDEKFRRLNNEVDSNFERYADFRQIIDRKDIDVVIVATPDHWHAIPTLLACEAGKDVYVEKPVAHNIVEGRAMVSAARKHNRVVQAGLQQRSAPHFETMRALIADGRIGNVRYVRVWNFRNTSPTGEGKKSPISKPKSLDWDMFLGPAPVVPWSYRRYSNFRRYWDYAGGVATNFGTHRFDTVRHVMSLDNEHPKTVSAAGQRFEVHDGSEDPDMVQMTFEFDRFVLSYEACMLNGFGTGFRTPGRPYYNMMGQKDRPNGMAFYGTEGTIFADRLGFELYPELKRGNRTDRIRPEEVKPEMFRTASADGRSADSTQLHTDNFIQCVRSRKKPTCDVEIGHHSSILPHLGNIAARVGQKLKWKAETEQIENSEEASRLLSRDARAPWDIV